MREIKKTLKYLLKLLKTYQAIFYSLLGFFILSFLLLYFLDENTKNYILYSLMDKIARLQSDNQWILFKNIFFNNVLVFELLFFFNFFIIFAYLVTMANGLALALVLSLSFKVKKIALSKVLLALVPHGIIELPAFFLGSFISVLFWLKLYCPKCIEKNLSRWGFTKRLLLINLFIVFLFFIAALVEAFITYKLVQ